ncbi:hypothetical protein [Virgisporangium aurantiacum]|uniref:Uncharacterized protein n=1 Tax=Virgisporangium aurantiacum TaxID=175570 RepID=A0A8J4E079_9ACTN|nr:hypothetical protein [Virgisporangium aurantiacum]GIJ57445.1 hypothetical protein Vau01_049610 [Virgisporangium aurantiacum]
MRPVPSADRTLVVQRFQLAATASVFMGAKLNESADRFFDTIARVGAEDPAVFDDVIALVEGLARQAYHPMMLAAEALAGCLLRSDDFAPVVRGWAHRPHPRARTAAVAAYSKASDFDRAKVDVDTLAELIVRLDAAPGDADKVTRSYLGRIACKLRDTDDGARLIELMAGRGPEFRIQAAHAIASDLSTEPPERHLEVLRAMTPIPLSNAEPPRRYFWLFLSLIYDADPSVARDAQYALQLIRTSWPELWNRFVNFRGRVMADAPAVDGIAAPPGPYATDAAAAVDAALADLRARTGREWTRDELARLTHHDLARSEDPAPDSRGVLFALRAPRESNQQWGVLTWDPDLLDQDQQAEAAGEEPIRAVGSPRLFLSYRWSHAVDTSGGLDFFAGALFGRGYDLVFDRDPRHLDKHLTAYDVLLLLYGCTHFVPLLTDELVDYLAGPPRTGKTPIDLEMELARTLEAEGRLRWLPTRLDSPWPSDELFPTRLFQVVATFPDGRREESEPMERIRVRAALARARAIRDVVSVEVHDVTPSA